MTKFTFYVHQDDRGYHHLVVTRLSDGVQKYFFQAHGCVEGMTSFMNSMTDELTDGYFPKAHKKGSDVDNWAFLGDNPARAKALELSLPGVELAKMDLTHSTLVGKK